MPDSDLPQPESEPASVELGRRTLFGVIVAGVTALIGFLTGRRGRPQAGVRLRPPGALPEKQFLDACARCFKCANACPNQCIQFHEIGAGLEQAFTPYIRARDRACILCGECTTACPTGALTPFQPTREGWLIGVSMGIARLNQDMCFSYHGRTCGACYRACPLAGQAMTIGLYETPILHSEYCVGCGLCEQACLHLPQAIRVIPRLDRSGSA